MECFRLLFDHLAWIEHQFLSGIRDSRKPGSLWGMMRGVGGVRKSIHQSWLAKGLSLGLGLLCWGFKGVQEDIPWEEASTLQIGSVAFPPGQCTCQQLHLCHRLFLQDGDLAPCDFWLFPKLRGCRYETIEKMKEAARMVIDTLTQKLLERYNKCIAAGRDYFERGLEFLVCTINNSAHTNKSLETYRMHLELYIYIYIYIYIRYSSIQ